MKLIGPRPDAFVRPFASRVFNARRRMRASRESIARICGVTPGTVDAWERGDMVPEDPDAVLETLVRSRPRRSRDLDPTWPRELRDLRLSKGLTQRAVAKELGRSRASVSLWESGAVHPSLLKRRGILDIVQGMKQATRSPRGRKSLTAGRRMQK